MIVPLLCLVRLDFFLCLLGVARPRCTAWGVVRRQKLGCRADETASRDVAASCGSASDISLRKTLAIEDTLTSWNRNRRSAEARRLPLPFRLVVAGEEEHILELGDVRVQVPR